MSEEDKEITDYFKQYDPIILEVLEDDRENAQIGILDTNAELVEIIKDVLELDSFDILDSFDFKKAYLYGSMPQVEAYFYIAHLRYELFSLARTKGVGDENLNEVFFGTAQYWYFMLQDRFNAFLTGDYLRHLWLN